MQKYRTALSGLKLFYLSGAIVFLLACGGQDPDHQSSVSGRKLPQPGMHVYKDPVTGEFVAQPPLEDKSTHRVLPQSLQQVNGLDGTARPAVEAGSEAGFDRAQEYESPGPGGGTLLDLPAPYSETQE